MPKYDDDPNTGQRVEVKKTHRFRNYVVLPVASFFALIVFVGLVSNAVAPREPSPPPPAQQPAPVDQQQPAPAPAPAPAPEPHEAHVEVFGTDGSTATVSVMTDGNMSSSEVTLPDTQSLREGYNSVSVTRSPSVDSYMNGGQGDSGDVGCRIIRNGEVVDERTASGQFASVSCSKFL